MVFLFYFIIYMHRALNILWLSNNIIIQIKQILNYHILGQINSISKFCNVKCAKNDLLIISSNEASSHLDNSAGRYQTVSMIEVSRDILSIKESYDRSARKTVFLLRRVPLTFYSI
jgi:hypothetical protein